MGKVKCLDCGEEYNPSKNTKTVEEEIFNEGKNGIEKTTRKRPVPVCPECGSEKWEPLTMPTPEDYRKEPPRPKRKREWE